MATPEQQAQFVQQLLPYAQDFERKYGVPAAYTIAMAANETGWNAANPVLFGIKQAAPSGGVGTYDTWEDGPNGRYNIRAQFGAYKDLNDAFEHLSRQTTIRNAPTDSPDSYFNYLKSRNWATDRNYAPQLVSITNTVQRLMGQVNPDGGDVHIPNDNPPTSGTRTVSNNADLIGPVSNSYMPMSGLINGEKRQGSGLPRIVDQNGRQLNVPGTESDEVPTPAGLPGSGGTSGHWSNKQFDPNADLSTIGKSVDFGGISKGEAAYQMPFGELNQGERAANNLLTLIGIDPTSGNPYMNFIKKRVQQAGFGTMLSQMMKGGDELDTAKAFAGAIGSGDISSAFGGDLIQQISDYVNAHGNDDLQSDTGRKAAILKGVLGDPSLANNIHTASMMGSVPVSLQRFVPSVAQAIWERYANESYGKPNQSFINFIGAQRRRDGVTGNQ